MNRFDEQRVEDELVARVPALIEHIPFAPEEKGKYMQENTFRLSRGFDFRRCNSVDDVVREWLAQSAMEHGLPVGKEKR